MQASWERLRPLLLLQFLLLLLLLLLTQALQAPCSCRALRVSLN
jgi:hypothetical protein